MLGFGKKVEIEAPFRRAEREEVFARALSPSG